MSAIPFGAVARQRLGSFGDEPRPDKPLDTAWNVLEAANDLGDDATVAACRRVIDASLSGAQVLRSDLNVIFDYFK
jgi:hypothetical protein